MNKLTIFDEARLSLNKRLHIPLFNTNDGDWPPSSPDLIIIIPK